MVQNRLVGLAVPAAHLDALHLFRSRQDRFEVDQRNAPLELVGHVAYPRMLLVGWTEVQELLDFAVGFRFAVDVDDVAGAACAREQEVDVGLIILGDVFERRFGSRGDVDRELPLCERIDQRIDALRYLAVALVVPVSRALLVAQPVQHVQDRARSRSAGH